MKKIEAHLKNVIDRNSKDHSFGTAVQCFIKCLVTLDIDYIVMGSSALQTYLDYFHRIPGDFDITLPEQDISKIMEYCESDKYLRFEYNEVASKIYYLNCYYMHLIPDKMNIIDKIENKIFMRINVYHLDRSEIRKIKLINFKKEISVPVPTLEYAFCLNLFVRLDVNAFEDNTSILEKYTLDVELIEEFIRRVPQMSDVLASRFSELRDKLILYRPDLINKLPLM